MMQYYFLMFCQHVYSEELVGQGTRISESEGKEQQLPRKQIEEFSKDLALLH